MIKFAQHLHHNVGREKTDGMITGIEPGSRWGGAASHACVGGLSRCNDVPICTRAPLGAFCTTKQRLCSRRQGRVYTAPVRTVIGTELCAGLWERGASEIGPLILSIEFDGRRLASQGYAMLLR